MGIPGEPPPDVYFHRAFKYHLGLGGKNALHCKTCVWQPCCALAWAKTEASVHLVSNSTTWLTPGAGENWPSLGFWGGQENKPSTGTTRMQPPATPHSDRFLLLLRLSLGEDKPNQTKNQTNRQKIKRFCWRRIKSRFFFSVLKNSWPSLLHFNDSLYAFPSFIFWSWHHCIPHPWKPESFTRTYNLLQHRRSTMSPTREWVSTQTLILPNYQFFPIVGKKYLNKEQDFLGIRKLPAD